VELGRKLASSSFLFIIFYPTKVKEKKAILFMVKHTNIFFTV